MSKSTKSTKPLNGADVRAFYADKRHGAKRLAALDPKDRISVAPRGEGEKPLRGRISKGAVEHFNKTTSRGAYSTGNTMESVHAAKAAGLSARVAAFDAQVAVGARGPLSNEAKAALGLPVTAKAAPKSRKGK